MAVDTTNRNSSWPYNYLAGSGVVVMKYDSEGTLLWRAERGSDSFAMVAALQAQGTL